MKTNVKLEPVLTHEGAVAQRVGPVAELRRSVLTCLLFEDTFYEKGSEIASRIAGLVQLVDPEKVADLALEARSKMNLRHVPLFLLNELSKVKGAGPILRQVLPAVVQRADELGEFLSLYWKVKKHPISAGVKQGLAAAFQRFNEYQLAKYDREAKVKLRDVLFLVHAKPRDQEQADLWKRFVDGKLEVPDTWEVALSTGKNKKETWERLLTEKKLGGLACLRNLRNMLKVGVNESLIRERLSHGVGRAFPYRFVVAAKFAPSIEDAIEIAMLKAVEEIESLPGKTGLLIDVSGSMDYTLVTRGESRTTYMPRLVAKMEETSRIDVAAGLAILLREKAERVSVATFSDKVVHVPPRRGFALRDAIKQSQPHSSTCLKEALESLRVSREWSDIDRVIVVTDEQSHDGIASGWIKKSYLINVAPYKNGVGYGNGWTHIDGWSERVIDWIALNEAERDAKDNQPVPA